MFSKFQYNIKVPRINGFDAIKSSNIYFSQEIFGKSIKIVPNEKQALIAYLLDYNSPIVWISLEEEDHDPGRFWLKLITAARKFAPDAGEELLAGLVDHHAQPLFSSAKKFFNILIQNEMLLVLENINFIQDASWWLSTKESLANQNIPLKWIGIDYHPTQIDLLEQLEKDNLPGLLAWDVLWTEWLEKTKGLHLQNDIQDLEKLGLISFSTHEFTIPNRLWFQQPHHELEFIDFETRDLLLTQLGEWLFSKDEWLEGIRVLIHRKEFEQAGEILEKFGETWLEEEFDRLEMLFWLREIPSVLLESSPLLCWLAAKASKDLNMKFLMGYYINHAENSLASLSRFSRTQEQWLQMEINEAGLTIGTMVEKINQLKN